MLGRWWLLLSWDEGRRWTSAGGYLSKVLLPTQDELQPAVAKRSGEQEPGWHFDPTRRQFLPFTEQQLAGPRAQDMPGVFQPWLTVINIGWCSRRPNSYMLLTPPRADQSFEQGLSQLYCIAHSQSGWKRNFIQIKLAVKPLTQNQQLSGTPPVLLPRYLLGTHLSGFPCHIMHPHCLFAPVTMATLVLQARPAPAEHLGRSSQVSRITSIPGSTKQEQKDQRCCTSWAK